MALKFSIIIGILISSFESRVWATVHWRECSTLGGKEIPEEIKRIDCEESKIALAILKQQEITPTKLYHFGLPEYVEENATQGNVPQLAWDTFVMGGKSRYSLKPFRRGLYGTATLDVNEYHNEMHSALMEIEIKSECAKSSQTVSFLGLPRDPRFKKWFSSAHDLPYSSLEEFKSSCYEMDGPIAETVYARNPETHCEIILNRFLDEAQIKIVHDHIEAKSFYIRDRNCIKNIRGTPNDIVEILAEKTYLWLNSCASDADPLLVKKETKKLFSVLVDALKHTKKHVPDLIYKQLKENIKFLEYGKYRDEESVRKDWSDLLDAHQRCQSHNRMTEFRNHLKNSKFDGLQFDYDFNEVCPDIRPGRSDISHRSRPHIHSNLK